MSQNDTIRPVRGSAPPAGVKGHLLPGEYVLVEVELDLLVGDVDAELLEGVLPEVLKAEDVQDANGLEVVLSFNLLVDPHDDPGETLRIKCHCYGVSRIHSLQGSRTQRVSVHTNIQCSNTPNHIRTTSERNICGALKTTA